MALQQNSTQQNNVWYLPGFMRVSRSHRKGTPALNSLDETLKTVPYEQKRKVGVIGTLIFVGLLLAIMFVVIVVNYFWFRNITINHIDTESRPPAHAAQQ